MKFKFRFTKLLIALFAAMLSMPVFSAPNAPIVLFYSDLSDVRLYINDEEIGMLPVTFTYLVPGKYEIRAEKENYKPLEKTIIITDKSNQEFEIELEMAKGIVVFNVDPLPESINANGRRYILSENQNSIELTAGVYKISLEKFGFERLETIVNNQTRKFTSKENSRQKNLLSQISKLTQKS